MEGKITEGKLPLGFPELAALRWSPQILHSRLQSLCLPPHTCIRRHPHRESAAALPSGSVLPWHPLAHVLPQRPSFTLDPAFHAGAYYVQEPASMLLKAVLEQLPKMHWMLDLAAAPGGKTTLLLDHLNHEGWLLANEPEGKRFPKLQDNTARWGYANQLLSRAWPKQLADSLGPIFHGILLDAPCSGEGMFRKEEQAINQWTPNLRYACAVRQQDILQQALRLLAPGGFLIYATCTFAPEENQNHANQLQMAGLEPVSLSFPANWQLEKSNPTGWYAYPDRMPVEGLFFMVWKKPGNLPSAHNQIAGTNIPNAFDTLVDKSLFAHGLTWQNQWFASAHPWPEWWNRVPNLRSLGMPLGEILPGRIKVQHALALSIRGLHAESLALSREGALNFLRGQAPPFNGNPAPWVLARWEGLALGWLKRAGNRYNNLLPAPLRIRMQG